jgi:high-affinity Fe2+/Pb2+ permease
VRVPSLMFLFLYVFAAATADFFLFSGVLLLAAVSGLLALSLYY